MTPEGVFTLWCTGADFFVSMDEPSEIFADANGESVCSRAEVGLCRKGAVEIAATRSAATTREIRQLRFRVSRVSRSFFVPAIAYLFLEAVAEECASLSFVAHSSQQTSTVLPPSLTLMEFPSNLQSQAAQVVVVMVHLLREVRVR